MVVGDATYTAGIFGRGSAISFTQTSHQYVAITSKQLLLSGTSFTIELWIYPIKTEPNNDYGLFGQCSVNSPNLCFHFNIRSSKLYCAFWVNDVGGKTTLQINTWSHVACVYNLATLTQQVWLNGVVDGSKFPAAPYEGSSGTTTIGATFANWPLYSPLIFCGYIGYIDEVRFTWRAKNVTEFLNGASSSVC